MSVSSAEQTYRDITKEPEVALAMRDQLREARTKALDDAEGFQGIIWAIERLGQLITRGKGLTLDRYERALCRLAGSSVLAKDVPARFRESHTPFSELYKLVKTARNDALHQGAFARHLTEHAVLLSLILEDALMEEFEKVSDYMVGSPVVAHPWQPISFVRQQMLANSFSNLPIYLENHGKKGWWLLSDHAVAHFVREGGFEKRAEALAKTVAQAIADEKINPTATRVCEPDTKIEDVHDALKQGVPILIVRATQPQDLLGILTPFDLL
jgi:hypothetical protein